MAQKGGHPQNRFAIAKGGPKLGLNFFKNKICGGRSIWRYDLNTTQRIFFWAIWTKRGQGGNTQQRVENTVFLDFPKIPDLKRYRGEAISVSFWKVIGQK